MSGRVRVTLADGRWVTGYRKTERAIETRRRPHEMPDWRLSFVAPPELFLSAGLKTGVIGVSVIAPGPMVEVRGKNRSWCFEQLAVFLDELGVEFKVSAVLERETMPPTKTARVLVHRHGCLLWDGRPVA